MKNLSVENIYTRQKAKELTKKNFWRLLGMMLLGSLIMCTLVYGGIALLSYLTDAKWVITTQAYSYQADIDPTSIGAEFVISFVVLMIVAALLGTGLNLGLLHATTSVARDAEKVPVRRVFSRMKYFLKGVGLNIWVGFKTMLWALPGILVMALVTVFVVQSAYAEAATMTVSQTVVHTLLSLFPLLVMLLIFALVVPAVLRYYMSTYILADEPTTGVFECVRKSKAMMKGHKWQLFKLTIPYLLKMYGWMFLVLIVMGVVMVLMPPLQSEAASIVSVVAMVVAYVLLLWRMLVYALRSQVAFCLFYLKRKGEMPAIPPEEEERIVAWQPAAEKTASESVETDAANIGCWNPGGEVKPEKE